MSFDRYDFKPNYFELPPTGGTPYRMHFVDAGSGDPIVMLHGNPTWSYYYRNIIPVLAKTHRVIAPDHIGCGLSDKPSRYPYVLDQHIRNLTALLEHLELSRVSLLVHDWGGLIGFGYATRFPDRINRIAVLNTTAFRQHVPWFLKLVHTPGLGEFLVRRLNLFLLIALRVGSRRGITAKSPVRDGYLGPYPTAVQRTSIFRFVLDVPTSESHRSYPTIVDIEHKLPLLVEKPMSIFWGMRDPVFTPAVLEGWTARFPKAEVTRFENGGHFVLEDEFETIAERLPGFFRTDE